MESKDKKEKSGVARLRERYYEIKRNIKISPELEEATREKQPDLEKKTSNDDRRKIASPKRDEDLDL